MNNGKNKRLTHYRHGVSAALLKTFDKFEAQPYDFLTDIDKHVGQACVRSLGRLGEPEAALDSLKKAVSLRPDVPRYAYVYGVALNSLKKPDQALSVLKKTHTQHPTDRQVLLALVTINRDLDRISVATGWAEKLLSLYPDDSAAQQLLRSLGGRR